MAFPLRAGKARSSNDERRQSCAGLDSRRGAEGAEVKTRRVPAKAGTHLRSVPSCTDRRWTPAFAGEHGKLNYRRSLRLYANPVIFFPPAPTTPAPPRRAYPRSRSEEHTSELQSLMRISYAVFCLKQKKSNTA